VFPLPHHHIHVGVELPPRAAAEPVGAKAVGDGGRGSRTGDGEGVPLSLVPAGPRNSDTGPSRLTQVFFIFPAAGVFVSYTLLMAVTGPLADPTGHPLDAPVSLSYPVPIA
jgi:hypothetical protein